ncbi:phage tail protein [Massilia sp. 9096]|uniref:phage tail protein n=1 Tax=Massilia sp. 9096 TaxID=1500894 RepID=UPI00055E5DCE|nr:phage tail protein [Massilia sp. 9096]
MTQTFTWAPDAKPTGTTTFRVLKAQFGDGYAQTAQDGINNKSESWPVTFTEDVSIVAGIKAFLDALGGAASFQWTPPNSVPGFYKCDSYSMKQVDGAIWQLSATFNQSFQP